MGPPDTRFRRRGMTDSAVTHTLKSVRKHIVDVRLPPRPSEDQETFVLNVVGQGGGASVELSPGDFLTLIGVCGKVWADVTGDELRTASELRASHG